MPPTIDIPRAVAALLACARQTPQVEPFAAAIERSAASLGEPGDAAALVEFWQTRAPGSAVGAQRYRWELSHERGARLPSYASPPDSWQAWRPQEQAAVERDPFSFERQLCLPIILCENALLLLDLVAKQGATSTAQRLWTEAEPVLRRDFASYIQARHTWSDTFALWCLTQRPRVLKRFQPFALAIATCYAAPAASAGVALGQRYPFREKPLISATAQLASSLLALGTDFPLVATLVARCADERQPDGGWRDADEPTDVLTTLVTAGLMGQVDPDFDPEPTSRFFAATQQPDGWWRALGPEVPWLTKAIVDWAAEVEQPFHDRFRWPHLPQANRDQKTALPFYAYFTDVARLLGAIDGLSAASCELAFIDLAGFGAFNNRFGQDEGDKVLRTFADHLRSLPASCPVRDGGDEFLVVGAPTKVGLATEITKLRSSWPDHFAQRHGTDITPVAPRVLLTTTRAGDLIDARQRLGRGIGTLKQAHESLPPQGVQASI